MCSAVPRAATRMAKCWQGAHRVARHREGHFDRDWAASMMQESCCCAGTRAAVHM
jgi:hypothetical protein